MAVLSSEERRRCWAQSMRDRLCPPHWSKPQFRAAVDAIDDGLDGLVLAVASGLGIGQLAAARNMITQPGMFALMSLGAYRTMASALQESAETAAGSGFHHESGALADSVGRFRFAEIQRVLIKRRLGEHRAEEDRT